MAVYIDNFNALYRGMIMCHMVADTTVELLAMAENIGVNTKWLQHPGTPEEHFDICQAKKQKAISFGANEINFRQYARIIGARRDARK